MKKIVAAMLCAALLLGCAAALAETTDYATIGKMSVNGLFEIRGVLPQGYTMETSEMENGGLMASITSEDPAKPMMILSIMFNEMYADVERMNDLGEEDMKILEESFSDMNEVIITYNETGHGTKLLIAREVGSDTDFVDILTIYKGYFIEFNMTPNPKAANQALTDEQIQMIWGGNFLRVMKQVQAYSKL
mgnify:CR=1 FL=1